MWLNLKVQKYEICSLKFYDLRTFNYDFEIILFKDYYFIIGVTHWIFFRLPDTYWSTCLRKHRQK